MKSEIYCLLDQSGEIEKGVKNLRKELVKYSGKAIVISIEVLKKKRSSPQNRYLWGVVYTFVIDGMMNNGIIVSKKEVHEFLKSKFLKTDKFLESTGESLEFIKSSADLSKDEMSEYIEHIKQFSIEFLNVNIPDAGEQIEIT